MIKFQYELPGFENIIAYFVYQDVICFSTFNKIILYIVYIELYKHNEVYIRIYHFRFSKIFLRVNIIDADFFLNLHSLTAVHLISTIQSALTKDQDQDYQLQYQQAKQAKKAKGLRESGLSCIKIMPCISTIVPS